MHTTTLRNFAALLILLLDFSDALPGKICKIPNGDAGTCTVMNKCDPLNELHKKRPKTQTEDAFFRQSVASCGSSGAKLKVCCPPMSQWSKLVVSPVMYPETPINIAHVNEIPPKVNSGISNRIQDPPPLPLNVPGQTDENMFPVLYTNAAPSENIVESCGVDSSSSERIVGGNATEIDEYPWLALLEYQPNQFKCGGSLISRRHVLTAAHCLYIRPSKVRLSEYNITSEPTDIVEVNGGGTDSITVTILDVEWAVKHPEHTVNTGKNDIGLVKMRQDAEYGDFIKPICLPTVDFRNTFFTVATRFTVAGWGSDNVYVNSEVKRSLFVPYVPMDVCSEMYRTPLSEKQQICAGGEEGKDSCRGDSGGPLMYEDKSTAIFVVVGIVSFGHDKCGTKGHPGVYTYVFNYVDWINKTIKNNGKG